MQQLLITFVRILLLILPSTVLALSAEDIYEKDSPAIHAIYSVTSNDKAVFGSAVAVDEDILISNCHVVLGGNELMVNYHEKMYPAFTFYHNQDKDLCIFVVPGLNSPYVSIRKSSMLKIGEDVYAIGNPRENNRSISKGIVSTISDEYVYTDTSTAGGSSGGGLFDSNANLVGITTMTSKSQGDSTISIPTDWIIEVLPSARQSAVNSSSQKGHQKFEKDSTGYLNNKEFKKVGEYGDSKISTYKINDDCFLFWNGRLNSARTFSSIIWDQRYPNMLTVFPGETDLYSGYKMLYKHRDNNIEKSKNYIRLGELSYEMKGIKDGDLFPVLFVDFNENLPAKLLNSSHLIVYFKNNNGFTKVTFGLWGFSEAYSKCNEVTAH